VPNLPTSSTCVSPISVPASGRGAGPGWITGPGVGTVCGAVAQAARPRAAKGNKRRIAAALPPACWTGKAAPATRRADTTYRTIKEPA